MRWPAADRSDVVENPKNLKIVELEAPQLPRSLDDAQIALAVINTTYASQIGLTRRKTVSCRR
ncbi:D-methionine-binding transport system MetQ precursor [Escherichia coli]|uniref:D-methionine-binding transport system MetQ n=1 Tax=Escherichia coli TaxID=562 RepID=A0A3S4NS00_ECOLX|nr:D-methionine-binding transport system MetQ precursor [Escherichia coli]